MVSQTPHKVIRISLDIPAEKVSHRNDIRDAHPCIIDLIGGDQGSLWQGKQQGIKS